MNTFERISTTIRRSLPFPTDHLLWRVIRPLYQRILQTTGRNGLRRTINGTDTFLIMPELYNMVEEYEPDVWRRIMDEVRPGDVVADVGAFIGLYTLAIARRVGNTGRVYAFEPDPISARTLSQLVKLNRLDGHVEILDKAVGADPGIVSFAAGHASVSHVNSGPAAADDLRIDIVTLDSVIGTGRLDIVKIDVEGFEEAVLTGCRHLLMDPARAPRVLFIEVHPFAWPEFGVTDVSLLQLLSTCGYIATDLDGRPLAAISEYGEIVARRRD